jgi:hypothetical protein
MKRITQKLIIALVGFFFMLSACEISCSYFHNTFDDDYDYYVQPDNSRTITIFVHVFTDISLVFIPAVNGFTLTETTTTVSLKPFYSQYYSPPIHQRNCVWLI